MKTKKCPKCGKIKSVSAFHKCKSRKDGLMPNCKSCRRVMGENYRKKHPTKSREWEL